MKTLAKIRISDNEVIEAQTHETHILIAGPGEEIVEIDSDTRPLCGMIREGKTVRLKRPEEIHVPVKDPAEAKREQDYSKALDKIATAAGLSKDEKEALKEKERANVKKNS